MEKRIREYEKFIKKAVESGGGLSGKELWELHRASVMNFQHERLVHLIIMLFFIVMSLVVLAVDCVMMFSIKFVWVDVLGLWPIHVLAILMVGLSVAYVKHYHFLENHIQELYDYDEKILKK